MCVYVLGSTKPNLVDPKKNQYFVKGHNTAKKEKKSSVVVMSVKHCFMKR